MTQWRKSKGELPGGRAAVSHFLPAGSLYLFLKKKESGKECWTIKRKQVFLIESNCSCKPLSIAGMSIAALRNRVRVHYHE